MLLGPAAEVEVVVVGCAAEDAFATGVFEVADLKNDGGDFDEKDATHEKNDDFLTGDEGDVGDDATEGERAGVAHENLRGGTVPPEEADAGTCGCASDDGEFADGWDVWDEKKLGDALIAGDECENEKPDADGDADAAGEAIHAIGDVGGVTQAGEVKGGKDDEGAHAKEDERRVELFICAHVGFLEGEIENVAEIKTARALAIEEPADEDA